MIIKKKYTNLKKQNIEPQDIEKTEVADSVEFDSSYNESENFENESEIENVSIEQKELEENNQVESFDDLNLSVNDIKFDSRPERREGTRRRGYRRVQDRNVVSRAQKEAISIKEAAKHEGYNIGIENANKDIDSFRLNFEEFFTYKDEMFEKISGCIMDISVEIAKKIIKKEVETDKELIISMIKGVIEEVNKTENKITLKVMPKDVEIVRDKISDIFSNNYFEAKISVVPDNDIQDGGVIVETSNGIIDASIKTQLAIMEKVLKNQEEK